jgi:hypothetical protein
MGIKSVDGRIILKMSGLENVKNERLLYIQQTGHPVHGCKFSRELLSLAPINLVAVGVLAFSYLEGAFSRKTPPVSDFTREAIRCWSGTTKSTIRRDKPFTVLAAGKAIAELARDGLISQTQYLAAETWLVQDIGQAGFVYLGNRRKMGRPKSGDLNLARVGKRTKTDYKLPPEISSVEQGALVTLEQLSTAALRADMGDAREFVIGVAGLVARWRVSARGRERLRCPSAEVLAASMIWPTYAHAYLLELNAERRSSYESAAIGPPTRHAVELARALQQSALKDWQFYSM